MTDENQKLGGYCPGRVPGDIESDHEYSLACDRAVGGCGQRRPSRTNMGHDMHTTEQWCHACNPLTFTVCLRSAAVVRLMPPFLPETKTLPRCRSLCRVGSDSDHAAQCQFYAGHDDHHQGTAITAEGDNEESSVVQWYAAGEAGGPYDVRGSIPVAVLPDHIPARRERTMAEYHRARDVIYEQVKAERIAAGQPL